MNITLIKLNGCLSISRLISLILVIIFVSACQLNNTDNYKEIFAANTVNYGQYYLTLKKLSKSELLLEIKRQKLKKSQGSIEAEINLLLLFSLPNSPIHNAYSAKSQLNEQLKKHASYLFSSADQAFVTLLKDQLNQQLYLFQQLIEQEIEHNKQSAKHLANQKYQNNKNAELKLKVNELTNQINQLKKIEQAINEHG